MTLNKIQAGADGNFIINGDVRQRGSYDYVFTGNGDSYLRVFPVHDTKEQGYRGKFPEEWVKGDNSPFADAADFKTYIGSFFFSTNSTTASTDPDPVLGAFGEQITAHKTPIIQISNRYQRDPAVIEDIEIFEATGGSADNNENKLRCQTGTSLGGYAVVRSNNTLNYKAGQGVEGQFTASFTTGIASSLQFGGMFSISDTLAFGYDGVDFSCLHSYGGLAEVQKIVVTATGAGTTTVTLDNDAVAITTTAGTVQTVAEEIRAGLAGDPTVGAKWRFEQVDDAVFIISRSVGDKTGTFSVTGASTATISEVTAGRLKTDNHTAQADWNVTTTPFTGFDPTKLNVYKIQFGYLGIANIKFSIYNPNTGSWVLVHQIKWANANNQTHLGSPNLKIGWTAASLGSTGTNLTVEGASASLMIEGDEVLTNDVHAAEATKGSIGTTSVPVLELRNRTVFGKVFNLGKIKALRLSVDNDHTKGAIIELWKTPTLTGTTNYQFINENTSIAVIDEAATGYSGGKFIDGFTIGAGNSKSIDLADVLPDILPDETLTVTAKTSSGTGATITTILTWQEDK
jgi:hypothetical protein